MRERSSENFGYPGEEDEVRPKGQTPATRTESNPLQSKPRLTTLPRPSRLSPNQKAQLRPNPSATTQEQKPNRPETRKPNPTPDAHSPTHLHMFPFSPGPVHHSQSTQTRDCNQKLACSTQQPTPRPETVAHASPSGCATWHVCSATPLDGGFSALAAYLARKTCFRPGLSPFQPSHT